MSLCSYRVIGSVCCVFLNPIFTSLKTSAFNTDSLGGTVRRNVDNSDQHNNVYWDDDPEKSGYCDELGPRIENCFRPRTYGGWEDSVFGILPKYIESDYSNRYANLDAHWNANLHIGCSFNVEADRCVQTTVERCMPELVLADLRAPSNDRTYPSNCTEMVGSISSGCPANYSTWFLKCHAGVVPLISNFWDQLKAWSLSGHGGTPYVHYMDSS